MPIKQDLIGYNSQQNVASTTINVSGKGVSGGAKVILISTSSAYEIADGSPSDTKGNIYDQSIGVSSPGAPLSISLFETNNIIALTNHDSITIAAYSGVFDIAAAALDFTGATSGQTVSVSSGGAYGTSIVGALPNVTPGHYLLSVVATDGLLSDTFTQDPNFTEVTGLGGLLRNGQLTYASWQIASTSGHLVYRAGLNIPRNWLCVVIELTP